MNSLNTLALAASIGALAGLRTFTPPAIVSNAARHSLIPLRRSRLAFLRSSGVANTITTLAIGELVADKLPSMPSRLEASAMAARVASGAVCGAAIASGRRSSGRTIAAGAVLGGIAAIGGAFANTFALAVALTPRVQGDITFDEGRPARSLLRASIS